MLPWLVQLNNVRGHDVVRTNKRLWRCRSLMFLSHLHYIFCINRYKILENKTKIYEDSKYLEH